MTGNTRQLKLAGYQTVAPEQFQKDLVGYSQRVAQGDTTAKVPLAAQPVYADSDGNRFLAMPADDGVAAMPFIPGSPGKPGAGGFVAAGDMPQGGGSEGMNGLLSGMAAGVSPEAMAGWLGNAAAGAMLGGSAGTGLAQALGTLGLDNPMARGVLGGAVSAAAGAAGLGGMGSLLGSALSGGPAGLAHALGSQALSGLLNSTGLGKIPGAGAVAGMVGGQLGNLADALTGGGWSQAMNQAGGVLNNLLGSGAGGVDASPIANAIVAPAGEKPSLPDLNAIGAQALDQAADQLLGQWKVDDESSAAEHIANKLVNDYKAQIKEALQDAATGGDGTMAKLRAMFSGATSSAVLPAARISDPDVKKPEIVMNGAATVLAEGLEVARMKDKITPSQALILQGAATVLTQGEPTARVTSKTDSPGVMIEKGAASVLVGGPSASIAPPSQAPGANPQGNAAPQGPASPSKPSSGSGKGGEGGAGDTKASQGNDATNGSPGTASPPASPTSGEDGEEPGGMCKMPEQDPGASAPDGENQCTRPLNPTEQALGDRKLDPDDHRDRNQYNQCPSTEPSPGVSNGVEWWTKDPDYCHRPLATYEGKPVDGSLGPGSYECSYRNGQLVDNVQQAGTYNYFDSRNHPIEHAEYDLAPHWKDDNYSHINATLADPTPTAAQYACDAGAAATYAAVQAGQAASYVADKASQVGKSVAEATRSAGSRASEFIFGP